MFNICRKEIMWGGRKLVMETGKVARQADGAVLVTYGGTTVLATVVAEKKAREDIDFFPLSVHYQEKYFASGRIPGGYGRREGRPSEKEVLVSRLIDRPLRPLFMEGFSNEVQVIITVLSYDLSNDPDVVGMIAASAAVTLSGVPFMGPIGAAKIGFYKGSYVLNPVRSEIENMELDLVMAATHDAVMMVESEAKELTEEQMLGAIEFGHSKMQPVIDMIIELAEEAGKEPWVLPEKTDTDLLNSVREIIKSDLETAFAVVDKQQRRNLLTQAEEKVLLHFSETQSDTNKVKSCFKKIEQEIVRLNILEKQQRIDGRDLTTVRPIVCENGLLERTHGSALFTRGETQAFVVTTLGTEEDQVIIDALEGSYRERFMLHYNFPPYSVGETGRMSSPGRREIGHGKLAWRALRPVLPAYEDFPYTIRIVSEITESNGSSSMATVCGGSLALMDAGVPVKSPVAGIAMGLIKEGDRFAVLSDILGDEDHLGDMDFKVAGTEKGVTSLQMDIKIAGITSEIMTVALSQAKQGRTHILGEMNKALNSVQGFSIHAPRIETISIPVDKIREIIGTGGKVIRDIVEDSGAKIDIGDDGLIKVASSDQKSIERALYRIRCIVSEPELGQIYDGKVVKVLEFGVFVNFFGSRDGLVHVSQIANHRINKPSDILKEGDVVKVKMLGMDDKGKVRLSMKNIDQQTGQEIAEPQVASV